MKRGNLEKKRIRGHSFSTYTTFFKKITFQRIHRWNGNSTTSNNVNSIVRVLKMGCCEWIWNWIRTSFRIVPVSWKEEIMILLLQKKIKKKEIVVSIKEKKWRALYTHYYAHLLNLVVSNTMKTLKVLRDAIEITFKLTKLVKTCLNVI